MHCVLWRSKNWTTNRAGVLERVDHSDCAAQTITVPKPDGQVRICGDYKVTTNPVLDVDQYPLPRPEDLLATLAGGRYFQHSTSYTPTIRSYLMTMLDNSLQSTPIMGCTNILAYLSVWSFFTKQIIEMGVYRAFLYLLDCSVAVFTKLASI